MLCCNVQYLNQFFLRFQRWRGPSWSYGSWIYNYLCNQCLLPLMLWVRILLRQGVLNTTLCDKSLSVTCSRSGFSPGTLVSSINNIDPHDIIEILLKVALNTITYNPHPLLKNAVFTYSYKLIIFHFNDVSDNDLMPFFFYKSAIPQYIRQSIVYLIITTVSSL